MVWPLIFILIPCWLMVSGRDLLSFHAKFLSVMVWPLILILVRWFIGFFIWTNEDDLICVAFGFNWRTICWRGWNMWRCCEYKSQTRQDFFVDQDRIQWGCTGMLTTSIRIWQDEKWPTKSFEVNKGSHLIIQNRFLEYIFFYTNGHWNETVVNMNPEQIIRSGTF